MLSELQKKTAGAIVNIFETGRVHGDYSQVSLLPGDPGHLTYGRSQTTLASGNLYLLIKAYCEAPRASLAARLRRFLARLAAGDASLDRHGDFRVLLEGAGHDPVMQTVQDRFFDRMYWEPSVVDAGALGIDSALGTTVVYDSHVHGSWKIVRARTEQRHGACTSLGERAWIERYVETRRDWLANHRAKILHATVYRMTCLAELIARGAWDLPLPLRVRGVIVDEASLGESAPLRVSAPSETERLLLLRKPLMRGHDVKAFQQMLASAGHPVKIDGRFGARTDKAVRALQRSRGLKADGIVGPATRAILGL